MLGAGRRRMDVVTRAITGLAAGSTFFVVLVTVVVLVAAAAPASAALAHALVRPLQATAPRLAVGVPGLLIGTLASAAIALVLATPAALGAAVMLAEYVPARLAGVASFLVEFLAGVPSVVYGLWGLVVVVPWLSRLAGGGTGTGLLASGLVLAVMVLPTLVVTIRDLLLATPVAMREGALALGSTHWEVVRRIALPWARPGIVAAVCLGFGRALGEAMVVVMVGGTSLGGMPRGLLGGFGTLAGSLVVALTDLVRAPRGVLGHTLATVAFLLLFLTVLVHVPARALVARQLRREAGGL
jgi:phosphate transport system permease protein